ncbi:LuxR C-terminal-related transcriptional regulator [Streptomyces sp. NPDC059578]|uniref:LuxR C-terminal-related transcriptional regulator n=1 Tax=Streptomyces sp. NPDC059578 TaxID=3346874 RepID=UPI0036823FAE
MTEHERAPDERTPTVAAAAGIGKDTPAVRGGGFTQPHTASMVTPVVRRQPVPPRRPPEPPVPAGCPLTAAQLAVLTSAAYGETGQQTAARLRIAYGTVRTHRRRARAALGARTAEQALAMVIAAGWVTDMTPPPALTLTRIALAVETRDHLVLDAIATSGHRVALRLDRTTRAQLAAWLRGGGERS